MDFKQLKYLINSDLYRLNYTPSTTKYIESDFFQSFFQNNLLVQTRFISSREKRFHHEVFI